MNMNNREIGIMLASFIIISLVAFLIIINITKEKDLSVSITPEQELEYRRIVEKNEKWFEGYKQGQVDAINGRIVFKLEKNQLGEIVWVHK